MKTALALATGITLTILAYALWQPTLGTIFHDQPATHPDCTPRYRTWHNGQITHTNTI